MKKYYVQAEEYIQAHMNSLKCEITDDVVAKFGENEKLDIVNKVVEYKAVVEFDGK